MTTVQKALLAAAIAAICAFLMSFIPGLTGTPSIEVSPVPAVSASPSPVVSSSPSPAPSPSAQPSPTVTPGPVIKMKYAMRGEVLGWEVLKPTGTEIPSGVKVFEEREVTTLVPSFKGARVGKYKDPLVPTTTIDPSKDYWIDFKPASSGTFKILGEEVKVEMLDQDYVQKVPFYMELQFAQVSRAHGLADEGSTLKARGDINAKYRALYREHGIEPIKQAMEFYPTDQNNWSTYGVSWKQTVVDGAIAPPCLLGPDPNRIPELKPDGSNKDAVDAATKSYVDAVKRLMSWAPNGWVYPWDEGEGTMDAQALARSKLVKSAGARVYITRQWSQIFDPFVDVFIAVINWFNQPGKVPASSYGAKIGLYASCMSNGNCANHADASTVAAKTAFPGMVLDGDPEDPRRFVIDSLKLGAKVLLYFNGTQKLPTAWEPGGQYNEGGNGDGTLVYPCPDKVNACPSLRMKRIRVGLQDFAKGVQ